MYEINQAPKRVVIYARVSTEHEAQINALENQLDWYKPILEMHKEWQVVNWYVDKGITGTSAEKRPQFMQMMEDAKKKKFDLIITREVSRFARNTVDTLQYTRMLKEYKVEVMFINDGIQTFDGDGELRLSLMATLAQEESRKVSERVKAGQQISRLNGTVYGCGNILGYDRDGDTYKINPEQAETVKMVFDMYAYEGLSSTKIADELTKRQRLNASGKIKWTSGVICRMLNNQTYMGVMAYGKSFSNNYLEQKRVNNLDATTYMCVKADFEPIVSEEEWMLCQEIKSNRVKETLSAANLGFQQKKHHGARINHDLWGSKLQCSCGHSFRKNRWHKNKGCPWSYGYDCYNKLNNGSAKKRREVGVDDTGYCDQPMIADWKLDLMAKFIFQHLWIDKKEVISKTCELIKESYRIDAPKKVNLTGAMSQIEKYKNKKKVLLEMRTDGEITKEEYIEQKTKIDNALAEIENEYQNLLQAEAEIKTPDICWDKIQEALENIFDFSQPTIDHDIIRKFVSKIVPDGKTHFRWYMNLDGNDDTSLDMVVDGRKNHAVVSFDEGGDKPPLHNGEIISINDLQNAVENDIINTSYKASQDK